MPSTDETRAGSYGPKSLSDRSNAQQRRTVQHTVAAKRQQQHDEPRRHAAILSTLRLKYIDGIRGTITI